MKACQKTVHALESELLDSSQGNPVEILSSKFWLCGNMAIAYAWITTLASPFTIGP